MKNSITTKIESVLLSALFALSFLAVAGALTTLLQAPPAHVQLVTTPAAASGAHRAG